MINRYIITAAEIGAEPNHRQLDAYETYAKHWDAKIVVIPIEGQHKDGNLDPRFDSYLVAKEMPINKNVEIYDFCTKAQQINPLTGLRRFGSVDKSILVGSTKQHLEHVANSASHKPKAVMATGACTLPQYKKNTRIGRIAEKDHTQGAILLESENNKYFHFRQAQNILDGSFIDLGIKYTPNGKVIENAGTDTLILGDLHDAQKDIKDYKTSLEMIDSLQPKVLVLHDVFDAYSVSHHDTGKQLLRAKKSNGGHLDLRNELYNLGATLHELTSHGRKDMKTYVVKSNHCEHLERYLDECRYTGDSMNLELSVKLAHAMLQGKDPIAEGVKLTYGSLPKNIKFLQRDDELKRYGWELAMHGDKGPNGSRGSIPSFEYSLGKAFVGHAHSAAIRKNVFRVGTLLKKDVDYAKGSPGSWTTTHGVIYPNGKGSLVNIYGGKWTA